MSPPRGDRAGALLHQLLSVVSGKLGVRMSSQPLLACTVPGVSSGTRCKCWLSGSRSAHVQEKRSGPWALRSRSLTDLAHPSCGSRYPTGVPLPATPWSPKLLLTTQAWGRQQSFVICSDEKKPWQVQVTEIHYYLCLFSFTKK